VVAAGRCDSRRALGHFEIERAADYTAVSGVVTDAVAPTMEPTLVERVGACQLLRRNNAFCDPPCGAGQFCSRDGRCLPYPKNVNVGTVSVHGLRQPLKMEPKGNNQYFDTTLPADAVDENAPIRLEASGGDGPPFAVEAPGIALLQLTAASNVIAAERDFVISWTSGRAPARVRVQVNVDQHGTTPVTVSCELPDSGQLMLEAALVSELLAFGVSGFPTLTVTRQAGGSTSLPAGCVGLDVISAARQALSIPGHTPCKRNADCPVGLGCDVASESCR
jgi:hypothetical protein